MRPACSNELHRQVNFMTTSSMEIGFQLSLTIEPISDLAENEPNSSHVEYRGNIRLLDDEGEALTEIIGRVKFYVIHFANSWPAFDVFDVDPHTAPFAELLSGDDTEQWSPHVKKLLQTDDDWLCPILLFDRLGILPEARGRGLGLKVIEMIVNKFGTVGCGFAALKSFPLQLEVGRDNLDEFEKLLACDAIKGTPAEAHERLARYYRKAGFRRVPHSNHLMIRNLLDE